MGLWYSKDTDMSLTAYADADHAGCQDTRHSTSGSAQFLGDKLVSWSSKKQKSTAISSTEAEYISLSGSKHIDIRYHFIKEQVENGIVELYFVRTEYQLANIFTKPMPRERFNFLIDKLGMRSMSPETLKRLAEETFKIDKRKDIKLTLEGYQRYLQICPRVHGRDFDALPSEEDTLSLRDLGHIGVINSINDVLSIRHEAFGELLMILSTEALLKD
ncbi:hypothetical protein Tco_0837588 [Tanacetum coccineum]